MAAVYKLVGLRSRQVALRALVSGAHPFLRTALVEVSVSAIHVIAENIFSV
jgi:hypothetical protein